MTPDLARRILEHARQARHDPAGDRLRARRQPGPGERGDQARQVAHRRPGGPGGGRPGPRARRAGKAAARRPAPPRSAPAAASAAAPAAGRETRPILPRRPSEPAPRPGCRELETAFRSAPCSDPRGSISASRVRGRRRPNRLAIRHRRRRSVGIATSRPAGSKPIEADVLELAVGQRRSQRRRAAPPRGQSAATACRRSQKPSPPRPRRTSS